MAKEEYIAKEFVIDAIEELKTKPMPKALLLDHLTKIIEIFPTEDFAPVVRCKDCEFSGSCSIEEFDCMKPDDYCSKGKRKENDNG